MSTALAHHNPVEVDTPLAVESVANMTTDELSERVREAHLACVAAQGAALLRGLEVGQLLIAAKEKIARGDWLCWLDEHCRVSNRQAQRYMNIYRRFLKEPHATRASFCGMSLREAERRVLAEPATAEPATAGRVRGRPSTDEISNLCPRRRRQVCLTVEVRSRFLRTSMNREVVELRELVRDAGSKAAQTRLLEALEQIAKDCAALREVIEQERSLRVLSGRKKRRAAVQRDIEQGAARD